MGEEPPSIFCILFDEKQGYAEKARALLSNYIIDPQDLEIEERIGEGSSGIVYRGTYKGEKVAIKQLKSFGKGSKTEGEFRREVLSLISCAHKNVLKLYGVSLILFASPGDYHHHHHHHHHQQQQQVPDLCIVTKFMEGGSLQRFLMHQKHLKLKEILAIAEDVACGMEFLHSRGILHMDLKTANVFLDEDGNAVIGDLGVARLANEKVESGTDVLGTYRWMAPEVCGAESGREGGSYSFKSDVYSFGILLWELVTCKMPYADYNPVQAAVGVVMHGLRPDIPADCFPPLRYLIQKCWDQNPSVRPHFSEIRKMLGIISYQQDWRRQRTIDVHDPSPTKL